MAARALESASPALRRRRCALLAAALLAGAGRRPGAARSPRRRRRSSSRCPRFRRRRNSPPIRTSSRRSRSRRKDGETVEEARVNGRVVWIKVTPRHGRPYFLIPDGERQHVHPPRQPRHGAQGPAVGAVLVLTRTRCYREPAEAARHRGAPRLARCRSTPPSSTDELEAWLTRYARRHAGRAGADRVGHREHQLLRHDHARAASC